jgi:hypothetical protein
MERPIEKHRAMNHPDIFVTPRPAPPSPADSQFDPDGGSSATPERQFHQPKHVTELAGGAIHTSSPSSFSHKPFPPTIVRLLQLSSGRQLQDVVCGMEMIFSTWKTCSARI